MSKTGSIHYLNKTRKTPVAPTAGPLPRNEALKSVPPAKEATLPKPSQNTTQDSVSPALPTLDDEMIQRIEAKIDKIEKEFLSRFKSLETRAEVKSGFPISHGEFSSLIHRLEEKMQRVSDDLLSNRHLGLPLHKIKDGKGLLAFQTLQEVFMNLLGLLHHKSFQRFLKEVWFGQQRIDYEVDEFGMDKAFAKKVKPFFDFLYQNYWRVSVQGSQNVAHEGRGLIVANHSGTLPYDGAMIRLAMENDHPSRRDVRFLVEDFVYHFPFLGTFMYRIGGVRACPENAQRLLSRNHLVAVFPEGIKGIGKLYKNRYQLQRFGRGGFIKLALRTRSPIIPTAVIGAEEIHPLLYKSTILARPLGIPYIPITPTLPLLGPFGLIPLPSKWTILFGEPFSFHEQYGPEAADDQLLVNTLAESVRTRIQEMIMDALRARRSVWFG